MGGVTHNESVEPDTLHYPFDMHVCFISSLNKRLNVTSSVKVFPLIIDLISESGHSVRG
jgi:hypothetical protein